ncbi:PAS domain S-box protein [Novosphingobium sp.]|uniref:PAS domain S-box protein n=1 Tax=Novosphingobium sp. TaxID=1874826 RepID=UPI003B52AFB6
MAEPGWTEDERLEALRRYAILDTPPEPEFDDAVALVKTICDVPVALVSLVDAGRQWFKAKVGTDAHETDIDTSVCALAIRQTGIFQIEDLSADPRTAHMSLVVDDPKIRFYAGSPLVTSDGLPLGSLCAIDVVPRPGGLTADQAKALAALGRQVIAQIELRSAITERDRAITQQERRQRLATRDSEILQTMLRAQQRVLHAGGDFDTVLQALVEAALDAVRPAQGVVVEMRDGSDMVYRAGAGSAAEHTGLRFAINASFSGRALTEAVTMVSGDTALDHRADNTLVLKMGIRSFIIVPLTRQGQNFGVLKMHSSVPNVFKSRHILVGQMLGGLIAASFTESAETAAVAAAEHSAQSYRHIVDSAIDSAIISTDEHGAITSWSRGAQTIMGWTEAEMTGRPLATIFTPEDNAAGRPAKELRLARAEGRASDERWHIRKDGTRFYAHGAVTPLLAPAHGFVKSLRDITAEHATRSALDASRLQLDTALQTGLIGFFKWDVSAGTVVGDARFAEFFAIDRDSAAAGVPVAHALRAISIADIEGVERDIARLIDVCADYSQSYRVIDAERGTRWLLVRGRCVERDGDKALVYVGTAVDVTIQREAEDRLAISRERLELATRAAELGSFDYQPQTGRLDWDDRCRALFGLPAGVPVTYESAFLAGVHPDDRERTEVAVAEALNPAGTGVLDIEYRTIGIEDRVERAILAKGLGFFSDGVAVRLIGTVQDVTADRAARRQLLETEERFRLAVRATNDAIRDWDLSEDRVYWNDALEERYGHQLASIAPTGAWWFDHIHPDDRARIEHSVLRAIGGQHSGWIEEYRFRRGDGSYADVRDRGYMIRDDAGRAVRMIGALLDQSDRKAIERELQALNRSLAVSVTARTEELGRLWDTSPDLLAALTFDGTIGRVNPAWTAILGYAAQELIGHSINEFVVAEDIALIDQALKEAGAGPMTPVENRYRHKDGTIRWISWVAAQTENEIYATGRHITAAKEAEEALRKAEDQLRQSQKVEAIGQLTGGVAHDFNNLLTVIRGSTDLLRRGGLSDEKRLRYLDAISDTAERATKLTSQLLAFARRSSLQPVVFDVGANVRTLLPMLGTLTGSMIEVVVEIADAPGLIDADPSQFDTAIVNMAVNARDAMDRQGKLTVRVETVDHVPAIRNHPPVRRDHVAVAITDTGSGIPADKIDQIFEPFFTTKDVGHGTGLGLSQVFGFAKQSGGEIQVESVTGQGTTFTLYLPSAQAAAPDHVASNQVAARHHRHARVLVVEDNADVGSFATNALAELGHFTVFVQGGEDALERLATDPEPFDAVFSDVVMPGMTGIDLGQQIRNQYPDLPVLLTSGYSSVLVAEGTHGFDLLQKPYSLEELSRAVQRVMAQVT